jgi:hypothetical protein
VASQVGARSCSSDARADEAPINVSRKLLEEDEPMIGMGKLQPDRRSGGMATAEALAEVHLDEEAKFFPSDAALEN